MCVAVEGSVCVCGGGMGVCVHVHAWNQHPSSVCVCGGGGVCVGGEGRSGGEVCACVPRAELNTLPGILVGDHPVLSAEDTKS